MAITGAGMKCVKYTVFAFNFLFFLCGLALIIVGALVEHRFKQYGDELGKVWQATPIAIIVLGVIIFVVSFLGCCGSLKESICMLYLYSALLVIIIIAEIAAAIAAVVLKGKVKTELQETITKATSEYDTEVMKKFMDLLQQGFKCCGANGPSDYATKQVPISCYQDETSTPSSLFQQGCSNTVIEFVEKNIVLIAVVAFVVGFLQILGVVAACCLITHIKHYEAV